MTSLAFRRLARVTANTKRAPSLSGGKRAAAATHLVGLRCTPLDSVSAETARRFGLDTPYTQRQTFTVETDIVPGDFLVVGGAEYPIRAVANNEWDAQTRTLQLILEELKR